MNENLETSDPKLPIHQLKVEPEAELFFFFEQVRRPLSPVEAERLLDLLDQPPEPNAAFKHEAAICKARHGEHVDPTE